MTPDSSDGHDLPSTPAPGDLTADAADLRAELDRLRDREREIVELLGAESPDRILHDLRNLLNEVQLLRLVVTDGKA